MNMLKNACLALGVACGLLMAAPCDALAARTGIVDVNKVYAESKAGKAADAHLAKVQDVLQKGFAALEKRVEKAKKDERERELAAGRAVLERQMQIELAAARAVVNKHMLKFVDKWCGKDGVAMAKAQVLDYGSKLDITDRIIKDMNKEVVKFADLPVVSFKDEKKEGKKAKK